MKVFYRPEQCATSYQPSPSAKKPRLVVQDWMAQPDIDVEIHSFEPATVQQLELAHDLEFINGVLSRNLMNGFGTRSADVAASLPYTTGSMLAAAEHAVLHREVVCSPTSGFHHAEYANAMAYCTFNGLMVTALALQEAGLVQTVGILDCDAHYGNGTDQIIQKLGIHWIRHFTLGSAFHSAAQVRQGEFEAWLDHAIDGCLGCDLILYQAGADPHVDDPLGGVLSSRQMSNRDRSVFERLGHLPMVWNLAGGYQTASGDSDAERLEPVLALHRETARLHCQILSS